MLVVESAKKGASFSSSRRPPLGKNRAHEVLELQVASVSHLVRLELSSREKKKSPSSLFFQLGQSIISSALRGKHASSTPVVVCSCRAHCTLLQNSPVKIEVAPRSVLCGAVVLQRRLSSGLLLQLLPPVVRLGFGGSRLPSPSRRPADVFPPWTTGAHNSEQSQQP